MFSYLYGLIVAFILISLTVLAAMVIRRVLDVFERRRAARAATGRGEPR